MPYSGGTFSLYTPGNPVVTGTTISSTWANNTLSDIATGLTTCVLKDGTQTITQNLPMNSKKLTGLAAGSASGDSVRYEQVALLGNTTHATSFTFDGGGGSTGSLTLLAAVSGSIVTLYIPTAQATSGTGSTELVSNTALPSAIRPTRGQVQAMGYVTDNALTTSGGWISITTAGIISISRDPGGTAFTNTSTCGTGNPRTFTYSLQ